MREIIIYVIIGMCSISNSMPVSEHSTPIFMAAQPTTTEKAPNIRSDEPLQAEGEKQPSLVPTTTESNSSTNPPDHVEAIKKSANALDITVSPSNKNEPTSSNLDKEEKMVTSTISSSPHNVETKDVTTILPLSHTVQLKEPTSSPRGHKIEPMHLDMKNQTEKDDDKKKKSPVKSKKSTKTSTSYINEGKVMIFNGICGPEGCEIEGDIYDKLIPITHTRKQG